MEKKIYATPIIDVTDMDPEELIQCSGEDEVDISNNSLNGISGDAKHIDFSDSESIW